MATIGLERVGIAGVVSGSFPQKRSFPVAASQTLYIGDTVYLSSGQITICATNATTIFGVMAEDSILQDADTMVDIYIDDGNTLFVINCYHASGASSSASSYSQIGTKYELVVVSGKSHMDIAASTEEAICVHDMYPLDVVGDYYGRVIVTFQPARQSPF